MPDSKSGSRFKQVRDNGEVSVYLIRDRYGEPFPVKSALLPKYLASGKMSLANAFMERWAMVMGEPDGEDAAGRQKIRRMTPGELVKHACDVAETAYAEFHARGWMTELPSMEEMIDTMKDVENGND